MRWRLAWLAIALCAASFVQHPSQASAYAQRSRVINYVPDQVFRIEGEQGYQITLQLGADERIENVAVGDSTAWQVTANNRGDLLFIKPVRNGVSTNMTVATDVRIYLFELTPVSGRASDMPYMVKFSFPAKSGQAVGAKPLEPAGHYRLGGARALRPSSITDDGERTYIEWPADSAMPAVFAIDGQGRETLVNGNMRDGRYVIDSVLQKLVFRIDSATANAVRTAPRAP